MTEQEYIAQNALGYEGDTFIQDELKKLIEKFSIKTIIETGTYRGATTKKLSELVDEVYTIEVKNDNFVYAKEFLKGLKNVFSYLGNSAVILPHMIVEYINDKMKYDDILFFLDAHWESYNPLLDELEVIARNKLKPVIFIHDFKNPDHPDFGYDSYNGQDYNFAWIKESIEKIYGPDGYSFHYNSQADGAKRGVIYIYPKG